LSWHHPSPSSIFSRHRRVARKSNLIPDWTYFYCAGATLIFYSLAESVDLLTTEILTGSFWRMELDTTTSTATEVENEKPVAFTFNERNLQSLVASLTPVRNPQAPSQEEGNHQLRLQLAMLIDNRHCPCIYLSRAALQKSPLPVRRHTS